LTAPYGNYAQLCFYGDSDGSFTKAIGTELDLSAAGLGPGLRSNRFSMFVMDGTIVIKVSKSCTTRAISTDADPRCLI
jgi:peroxiredoxin